jgi:hypothetical protein
MTNRFDLERTSVDGHNQVPLGLENCYRCKPIQGSNPCPSAPRPFTTARGSPPVRASRSTRALTGSNRHLKREGRGYSPIMSEVKPPPMWMVRLNVAMLRRGLKIGSQYLLSVRGRKSGEVRSTPISIATIDGSRYIVAAFSEAAWVQNVRASGSCTLGRGRNVEQVRLVELPVEERGPVLRAFLQQVKGGVRFFGSADPDFVVAGADRYPVFRLDSN